MANHMQVPATDWSKAGRNVVLATVATGKAAWWLTKKTALIVWPAIRIVAKCFGALITVWASIPDSDKKGNSSSIYATDGEPGYDANGEYGSYGEGRVKSSF